MLIKFTRVRITCGHGTKYQDHRTKSFEWVCNQYHRQGYTSNDVQTTTHTPVPLRRVTFIKGNITCFVNERYSVQETTTMGTC